MDDTSCMSTEHSLGPEWVVDARGQRCPMPLLMARRALRECPTEQTLTVLCTDPSSLRDFAAFARQAGYKLESIEHANGELAHLLRLKA